MDQARKKTGSRYKFGIRGDKVYVERYKDLYLNVTAFNGGVEFNITDVVGGSSATNSIQEMKNSILISSGSDDAVKISAKSSDDVNIAKFGLLQQVEVSDESSYSKNKQVADNLLKELNKIAKTRSIECFGNYKVSSGCILKFNYPELDFVGDFLVKSDRHKVSNGVYKMSLELESFNE